ncbi:protein translocase subunit SecD, partial [Candidatus Woesebacteria bacterium]|nr:protein translocase subunit SecD [Candidatus Woesebacteria bacterium]
QLEFKEYDEAAASEAAALNVLQGASDSADLLQQQQQDFMTFLASFKPSGLDGSHVKKATVQFSSGSAKDVGPSVQLVFDKEGAKLFEDITGRNIGKPLGIFIDGMPITQPPTVQQKIIGGEAVITGNFTVDEAKKLAISINSGALPIPVTLIQQSNIGPTLGKESVQKSIMAGAVGLSAVILFMILYYGRLGLIATVGLLIYALISYAIVRSIPIVLTLPGIAGFILSVGMAVDANILIFERIKEEQRKGKVFAQAVQLGFGKAMDAIKDANIATIMVAFILYNPLNWEFFPQFGLIRGFALTLFIGVVTSLFTGIVITKRLIEAFYTGAPITKKSKQS